MIRVQTWAERDMENVIVTQCFRCLEQPTPTYQPYMRDIPVKNVGEEGYNML